MNMFLGLLIVPLFAILLLQFGTVILSHIKCISRCLIMRSCVISRVVLAQKLLIILKTKLIDDVSKQLYHTSL